MQNKNNSERKIRKPGNILLGLGLLAAAFVSAAALPSGGWGLGGFLCFFTLGVTLIVEGFKGGKS